MNNSVFRKNIEKIKEQRDFRIVATQRKSYLVSEPIYDTTNFISEKIYY